MTEQQPSPRAIAATMGMYLVSGAVLVALGAVLMTIFTNETGHFVFQNWGMKQAKPSMTLSERRLESVKDLPADSPLRKATLERIKRDEEEEAKRPWWKPKNSL